jgi:SAM-dependent methyltransferase
MNLKGAEPERFGKVASFLYRRWAEPSLTPLYRRVGAEIPVEEGRLLDVGCGPGKLDRLLAAANPGLEIVALDASEAMLREARRGPVLPNLEFRQDLVEEAGFSRLFDFAVSVLSFHHWEEPQRGLEAVYAALKPGGHFWIYEPDPEAPDVEIQADRAPLWGWLRVPAGLQRLIARGHGFTEREIEEVVQPLVEKTSFGSLRASRRGSTFRLELDR